MNKGILIFVFCLLAFTPEKKYKFEFTTEQVQVIFTAIDNSSLPHDKVKEIEAIIQQQYTSQLPKPDSTNKKK